MDEFEGHSYGPTCALYESNDESDTNDGLTPPKVKAQFFYASPLPIDDPLSPLPPIQADRIVNQPPQPFSSRDNAALEEAWQGYQARLQDYKARPSSRGLHRMFSFPKFQSGQVLAPEITSPAPESSSQAFPNVPEYRSQSRHSTIRRKSIRKPSSRSQSPTISRKQSVVAKVNTLSDGRVMLDQDLPQANGPSAPNTVEEIAEELQVGTAKRRKHRSPFRERRRNGSDITPPDHLIPEHDVANLDLPPAVTIISNDPDSTISGRPFARAPSTRQVMSRLNGSSPLASPKPEKYQSKLSESTNSQQGSKRKDDNKYKAFVPVGVSRLHLVEFPELTMKPIYWNPINDTSHVIRATWFYKDTMLPVPADVANRLEIGYEDLKPYSNTYQDELNACVEHGAAAELKIVHKLWPDEKKLSRPSSALPDKLDGTAGEVAEELPAVTDNIAADPRKRDRERKLFQSYSVIYTDGKNAQILRPNALPSVSRNRKPLNSLRKGRKLGIAVVRGFNRQEWLKLHPNTKKSNAAAHARMGAEMSRPDIATIRSRRMSCQICEEGPKSKVSDLVLVIHGIGQKLSERVDSFHFTHAINGLRREFNVQLSQQNVQGSLKENAGIMVLPINWRLTVSFDDDNRLHEVGAESQYELKDITPETLPAVRSMISDVMLDIPYYMSHHKDKMISAVIREANRVYRLWCGNNPGFQDYGRVHLIAHSLGSAMAMDILSAQPTRVPRNLDLTSGAPSDSMFEFDTANLFCCGSPSGFFLLLNGANLVPRKGRAKPGMAGEDQGRGVASEVEKYGCLAVDNLYNIIHKNDPVAYQQNASVDRDYAAMLQTAIIPSATRSLFTRLSGSLRFGHTAAVPDAYGYITRPTRPGVSQMPSTVELETHNFTREEIAEKRMFLLNDNGQIDYFLESGGGPLEIQYLNMLSAHSSYWYLQDFIRFLVVEIGRKPGRSNTLPVLRAVKKVNYRRGEGL